ncbi:MbnP family protein [Sphingobacterium faecale]|uniref:Copper-binding protein MbnP-like domain-containing protein n=1 Tax=Sphingobacterium faecale TaxID=2803775 RepID=A0ABS1R5P9_9SPHI|nr:MbnP family protein [Sphingobacterium faecale]MBL1410027.1 hypothetical protein [Sphingobacterium faecale]
MKKQSVFLTALAVILFTSCEKEVIKEIEIEKTVYVNEDFDPEKSVVNLTFNHQINNTTLELGKNYTDDAGNTYAFDEIRYWVSNVTLIKPTGEAVAIPNSYYLVEKREALYFHGVNASNSEAHVAPAKTRESVLIGNVPTGEYSKIKFAIGVDPTYNDNFAITAGELNINQMSQVASWAWNTSYIFFRTKGTFLPKGGTIADALNFVTETGGNNLYREVELTLPSKISATAGSTNEISLSVNVLSTLKGLNVAEFTGQKAAGWSADPNLAKYTKFVNASTVDDMTTISDNVKAAIQLK